MTCSSSFGIMPHPSILITTVSERTIHIFRRKPLGYSASTALPRCVYDPGISSCPSTARSCPHTRLPRCARRPGCLLTAVAG